MREHSKPETGQHETRSTGWCVLTVWRVKTPFQLHVIKDDGAGGCPVPNDRRWARSSPGLEERYPRKQELK